MYTMMMDNNRREEQRDWKSSIKEANDTSSAAIDGRQRQALACGSLLRTILNPNLLQGTHHDYGILLKGLW